MSYKILLLSAYDAISYKTWRNRLLSMFPEFEWTQLVLPPRNFNWRIRGNSLQWALQERETLNRDYDFLIATSMVDLSSLRGFVRALGRLPSLVYFHENQFAYPLGSQQRHSNIEPQLVPLYSAYCADAIVFNSNYNRDSFLQGAASLLEKLPDRLSPELMQKLNSSEVIPVPLAQAKNSFVERRSKSILDVVWNHRWEYDKGPKLLLQLQQQIMEQKLPIRLHIVGQQFRETPVEFEKIRQLSEQHASALNFDIGEFGFVESRQKYLDLLQSCDVVLSTALHDFQGLAIQEACALGCTPLAPDSLAYPEYLEAKFLYRSDQTEDGLLACNEIIFKLQQWLKLKSKNQLLPQNRLQQFSAQNLKPKYEEVFRGLLENQNET